MLHGGVTGGLSFSFTPDGGGTHKVGTLVLSGVTVQGKMAVQIASVGRALAHRSEGDLGTPFGVASSSPS